MTLFKCEKCTGLRFCISSKECTPGLVCPLEYVSEWSEIDTYSYGEAYMMYEYQKKEKVVDRGIE